ncbi:hypothetical protein ACP4OV_017469 [Aristida adscensionis]
MVKKPNGMVGAKPASAAAGADPSKANVRSPGSVKTPRIRKRKAKVNREKAAGGGGGGASSNAAEGVAHLGTGTADGGAPALAPVPQPAPGAEASPVATVVKPATDAEGSVPLAPTPATAETSASAANPKPKPADADAAPATSKGKGGGANASGGDGRMKNRKERAKERSMNGKGKEKEVEEGSKGKGKKAAGNKDERSAGYIFMCNAKTKQECYQQRLFGLPGWKVEMVKKIKPGARLFLYDFDLKLLYGVYKAASKGGLNLVREAFNGKFPAQVKFKIDKDCLPLSESSFKHAIKENYSSKNKFDPELNSRQVHRLLVLFKPVNVPQSVPNIHREERHHYRERRQPYYLEEERRPSLPIEEVRQPRFDEERRAAVMHIPLEDPYRATRFAPLPESRLGYSLANIQDDHDIYYRSELHAHEPRHIPLALETRHVPLALERHHVPSVPEPRHVPPSYYHSLASSDDSYYRPAVDMIPERLADRTRAERTIRDPIIPRDHTTLTGVARTDRLEELYWTGGLSARGARVEELYRPGELAAHADRVRVATRTDQLEDPYRSDQLVTRAVDLPHHSTAAYQTNPAYAETSLRPVSARVNASGVPVSSLYSFAGAPLYR